jgi:hypothetical protein
MWKKMVVGGNLHKSSNTATMFNTKIHANLITIYAPPHISSSKVDQQSISK